MNLPFEVPNASNPGWREWTAPLLEFLSEPRTWPVIRQWAKQYHIRETFLINLVAWLSINELADVVEDAQGVCVWQRTEPEAVPYTCNIVILA